MNKIPSLITLWQEYAFRFRMWFAAMLMRDEYETNATFQEFNMLDNDDFVDAVFDTQP